MRYLILSFIMCLAASVHAQNTIWSHAIGNWRNGPVVYISPVIETTEAVRTPELIERYKADHKELREAADMDVLRFATQEEAEESRQILKKKYGLRKLEVVLLEPRTVPSQSDRP